MSQYLIDQIEDTDNIEVLTGTVVAELHGDERLEAITLQTSKTDEARTLLQQRVSSSLALSRIRKWSAMLLSATVPALS